MTDGTPTPTGDYVEHINKEFDPVLRDGYLVMHGGTLYNCLSPLPVHTFARRTPANNFTEVLVNGALVYREDDTRNPRGA